MNLEEIYLGGDRLGTGGCHHIAHVFCHARNRQHQHRVGRQLEIPFPDGGLFAFFLEDFFEVDG